MRRSFSLGDILGKISVLENKTETLPGNWRLLCCASALMKILAANLNGRCWKTEWNKVVKVSIFTTFMTVLSTSHPAFWNPLSFLSCRAMFSEIEVRPYECVLIVFWWLGTEINCLPSIIILLRFISEHFFSLWFIRHNLVS